MDTDEIMLGHGGGGGGGGGSWGGGVGNRRPGSYIVVLEESWLRVTPQKSNIDTNNCQF